MIDLDLIQQAIINLPNRPDKLDYSLIEMEQFFKQLYSTKPYLKNTIIINGEIESSPYLGIAQAHMNCIKYAKQNNFPYFLIMEDDIQFRPGSKEYATEAFKHLPNDWDILLGGLYSTDGLIPYNDYWQQTKEFCGLQFYIVHSRAYDKILSFKKNMHIDRFMAGRGELKCYVTNKFFAMQRPGFSDNVGMYKDYTDHLNEQIKVTKGFELL